MTAFNIYLLDYNTSNNTSVYKNIIEDLISFNWIERFSGFGEFKLTIPWSLKNKDKYVAGDFLTIDRSHRVMRVETRAVKSEKGGAVIELSGLSLEDIFNHRYIRNDPYNEDSNHGHIWRGYSPSNVARAIYVMYCSDYYEDPEVRLYQRPLDNVVAPSVNVAPPMYPNYVNEDTAVDVLEVDAGTVGDFFRKAYNNHRTGVALLRNLDGRLYFWAIGGRDLSIGNTSSNAHVSLEEYNKDIENVEKLTSTVNEKTGALVYSTTGRAVWHYDYDALDTKYELLEVREEGEEVVPLDELLAIAKNNINAKGEVSIISAETSPSLGYVYGKDYVLGDIVSVSDPEGGYQKSQIVEYTFTYDKQKGYSESASLENYRIVSRE